MHLTAVSELLGDAYSTGVSVAVVGSCRAELNRLVAISIYHSSQERLKDERGASQVRSALVRGSGRPGRVVLRQAEANKTGTDNIPLIRQNGQEEVMPQFMAE